jgi:hypothetical protein
MHASCGRNEAKRNAYMLLVGNLEGKRPLRRPRCRWADNIKMEMEKQDGVVWTGLVWLRIGTSIEPSGSIKSLETT